MPSQSILLHQGERRYRSSQGGGAKQYDLKVAHYLTRKGVLNTELFVNLACRFFNQKECFPVDEGKKKKRIFIYYIYNIFLWHWCSLGKLFFISLWHCKSKERKTVTDRLCCDNISIPQILRSNNSSPSYNGQLAHTEARSWVLPLLLLFFHSLFYMLYRQAQKICWTQTFNLSVQCHWRMRRLWPLQKKWYLHQEYF